MKYYKDNQNEVYAYESDGSQDAYIKPDLTPISEAEAMELTNPPLTEKDMIELEIAQDKKFLADHDWINSKLYRMEVLGIDTTEEKAKYWDTLQACEAARLRIRLNEGKEQ